MLYPIARHFLFKLNPEQAHDLSMKYLPRLLGTPLDCFFRQNLP
ncbi:MAG: quinone-dependent dihydroorotate dehydrogenase, partial [Aeromonas veronii]